MSSSRARRWLAHSLLTTLYVSPITLLPHRSTRLPFPSVVTHANWLRMSDALCTYHSIRPVCDIVHEQKRFEVGTRMTETTGRARANNKDKKVRAT